ncbi:MAG: hypothetical protein COV31_00085 [Candidatus Yanofskybacteria bacterium CG10_big_fil_rev_8_21_14_0_10_46_23]|uniref:Bacterial sugar transferase domain-containing protein n=1 Tax=Candidatus Yanofskybacteria bacterium CG10_big_fil_rev_8_21_14_0_10_46_23 TaxID=1975098 RepID=A0A2H0R5L5_9BACT|nr:MAG: hypothetical protein COV31_00085 [Candidatus Yanofskybacteria bacterium CG10_big_fil_rev_8_21_14_0_10_46_23]
MKRFLLFLLDVLSLYGALYLGLIIRYGQDFSVNLSYHLAPFSILFVIWLIVFFIFDLYEPIYFINDFRFFGRLWKAIVLSGAVSMAFFYLIPFFQIAPRTNLLIFAIVFTLINLGIRSLFNHLITKTSRNHTILIGLNQQTLDLAEYLHNNPQLGYRLDYIVDVDESNFDLKGQSEYFINIKELREILEKKSPNTIILSPGAYDVEEVIQILYHSLNKKIDIYNLPNFYEQITGKIPLGSITPEWFLENLSEGHKKFYDFSKRAFDILAGIIFGLIALPFFGLIALAIKIDSQGAVFYKQTRVGRYGQLFTMIKFRTMVQDAEKGQAIWAKKGDARVTRTGRIFRKFGIDELPQILNVLRGELSFIGPRSERPELDKDLEKQIPFYNQRYLVRPGLSGWAQIQYPHSSSLSDAQQKLQYDLFYLKNRSFFLDFSIFLKTIYTLLTRAV